MKRCSLLIKLPLRSLQKPWKDISLMRHFVYTEQMSKDVQMYIFVSHILVRSVKKTSPPCFFMLVSSRASLYLHLCFILTFSVFFLSRLCVQDKGTLYVLIYMPLTTLYKVSPLLCSLQSHSINPLWREDLSAFRDGAPVLMLCTSFTRRWFPLRPVSDGHVRHDDGGFSLVTLWHPQFRPLCANVL